MKYIINHIDMPSKTALIICPNIDGHRQNFCFGIGRWFADNGYHVVVAAGRLWDTGAFREALLLEEMERRFGVELVELDIAPGFHENVGGLITTVLELEKRFQPVWTFFPTGDEMLRPLDGLGNAGAPSSLRRCAIFIQMLHVYHFPRRRHVSLLRQLYEHTLVHYREKWRQNRYFCKDIWGKMGLTCAFSTNPHFIRQCRCSRCFYLPEIYRAWGSELQADHDVVQGLCSDYDMFLKSHAGKRIILYFGGWAERRGYDLLLNLCRQDKDTIFVSCGRPASDNEAFRFDVVHLRALLDQEQRIFEKEIPFLPDNAFTDMLFESAPFVLLPYNNFRGLSGLLVQAASYGKPVLVPDIGYMGKTVKQHRIGLCYSNGSDADFLRAYRKLCRTAYRYEPSVRAFAERYTSSAVDMHLSRLLSGDL
jgi:glycosyltransferase involved in cell wall biosynthesis